MVARPCAVALFVPAAHTSRTGLADTACAWSRHRPSKDRCLEARVEHDGGDALLSPWSLSLLYKEARALDVRRAVLNLYLSTTVDCPRPNGRVVREFSRARGAVDRSHPCPRRLRPPHGGVSHNQPAFTTFDPADASATYLLTTPGATSLRPVIEQEIKTCMTSNHARTLARAARQ